MTHLGFVQNKPVLTFYEKGFPGWGSNQNFVFRDYLVPNSADAFFFSLLHIYMVNDYFVFSC